MIKFLLLGLIKFYQIIISPFTLPCCRYSPICSEYAIEAIKTHGILYGIYFSAKRIIRCGPWGNSGFDPVPKKHRY